MRTNKLGYKLNLIPDKKDKRDFLYKAPYRFRGEACPSQIDYEPQIAEVLNQGKLGTCGHCAICAMMRCQRARVNGVDVKLSVLFGAYTTRALMGTVNQDSGVNLRTAFKQACEVGIAKDSLWPYDMAKFTVTPSYEACMDGFERQLLTYMRVGNDLDQMRSCLAHIGPFVGGFAIYDSFDDDLTLKTGKVPMPSRGWWVWKEKLLGYHAMCVVGYNDSDQEFKVLNSWGRDVGKGGFFLLPYRYLTDSSLMVDAWAAQTME